MCAPVISLTGQFVVSPFLLSVGQHENDITLIKTFLDENVVRLLFVRLNKGKFFKKKRSENDVGFRMLDMDIVVAVVKQ